MDKSTLEDAILEESDRIITAVREKEVAETKRLEAYYASELEQFRNKTEAETGARLRQELSKMENKAALERKKHHLIHLDRFINRMVEEVVKTLRHNARYKNFLIDAVREATVGIPSVADVRLAAEDMIWKEDIQAAIGTGDASRKIIFTADPDIRWGGCRVRDEATGRIFNHTLERVYFRKSTLIRQKVMKRLADHNHGGTPPRENAKE